MKSEEFRQSAVIVVRACPSEKEHIRQCASSDGMGMSEWLRCLASRRGIEQEREREQEQAKKKATKKKKKKGGRA